MHIVILTQYYPPEIGAPQNRLSDFARRSVEAGHRVTVLTAMPNYPAGRVHDEYRGKFYLRESAEGVQIHRSWIFATRRLAASLRLANYFSFVLSSLLAGLLRLPRADVLVTESPPLFLGITGYLLSRAKGARFVLNVSDLWPRAVEDMKVVTNRSLIGTARRLEEFLYRRAALITGQTQGIVTDIRRRMPRKRVRLVTNGADLDRFGPEKADPSLLDELGLDGRFIVGYAGVHGLAQSLDRVIDAAIHLKEFPDIVIACFGDGPLKERLVRQAREKRLENVRFFPAQCRERMPGLVALWGVGLVPLYGGTLARGALPSKMFEIMAASVPVLLSAPAGEASALIEEAQGGVCVEPENPAALAEAVVKLYRDASLRRQLGGNARAYVTRRYDRQIIAEQQLRHLSELGLPERAFVEPNPVLRS